MLCLCYQEPSAGLASRPNSMPTHWVCGRLGIDSPGHYRTTHQSKRTWMSLFCLPVTLPFMFHSRDRSTLEERFHSTNKLIEECGHIHQPSHHDQGRAQQCGHNCSHQQWDLWVAQSPTLSPSPDHRFKSDRSSVLTSSSVSSRSNRLAGSGQSHYGQHCRERVGSMKINLLVFKDKKRKRQPHIKVGIGI